MFVEPELTSRPYPHIPGEGHSLNLDPTRILHYKSSSDSHPSDDTSLDAARPRRTSMRNTVFVTGLWVGTIRTVTLSSRPPSTRNARPQKTNERMGDSTTPENRGLHFTETLNSRNTLPTRGLRYRSKNNHKKVVSIRTLRDARH